MLAGDTNKGKHVDSEEDREVIPAGPQVRTTVCIVNLNAD